MSKIAWNSVWNKGDGLDSLDDYLERRGGVDDGLSIEAEQLLITATSCPKCGGALSTQLLSKDFAVAQIGVTTPILVRPGANSMT